MTSVYPRSKPFTTSQGPGTPTARRCEQGAAVIDGRITVQFTEGWLNIDPLMTAGAEARVRPLKKISRASTACLAIR